MSATYPMDMVRGRLTVQVLTVSLRMIFSLACRGFSLRNFGAAHRNCFRMTSYSLCYFFQTEKSPYQYRGMFHALSTVLREEGPRALYKGWLPSVIGVVSLIVLVTILEVISSIIIIAVSQLLTIHPRGKIEN